MQDIKFLVVWLHKKSVVCLWTSVVEKGVYIVKACFSSNNAVSNLHLLDV